MVKVNMTKKDIADVAKTACDVILAIILMTARTRDEALDGVESLHRDMVRNVNHHYDEGKPL